MSKVQQLGFQANFANMNLNINPQGVIADPERYPEVTKKTFEEVTWYQTVFRKQLIGMYTQKPSIDNLCVNIVLEQGFQGYIYRQACKYFVLTCFQYTGANNGQLPNDVGNTFAKASVYTMDSVVAELKVVKQDNNSQQWFQWLNQFFGSPAASFFMQARKQILANMGTGGFNQVPHQPNQGMGYPQQNNMGYPPVQQGGYPQQSTDMGYPGNTLPVSQTNSPQSPVVDTGLAMDYLQDTAPSSVNQPAPATQTVPANTATVQNNILYLGDNDAENQFKLDQRMQVSGMWMTNEVTGQDAEVIDLPDWVLLGEGFTIPLNEISSHGKALTDIKGWEEKITSEIEALVEEAGVDYYSVFDERWDTTVSKVKTTYRNLVTEAVKQQLSVFNNQDGYICGVTDSVWGKSSWYELLCEQHGSESLQDIPDEDLAYTMVGSRIYPIIKSTSSAARQWAKRYRGKSSLPTMCSEHHGYLILPLWDNELNQQELHICSIIKRGTDMELEKYMTDETPVNNESPKANEEVSEVSPEKYSVVDSELFLPGTELGTLVNTLRIKTSNYKDTLIGTKVEPSYFIISDDSDLAFFDGVRERVGADVNDISDLANIVLDAYQRNEVTEMFVNQLESLIGTHLFNFIVNELNLPTLALDARLIEEISDVKDIILDSCEEHIKVSYVNAERTFLGMLFSKYEDDYLSILVPHFKATTSFQVSQNHGKYRVKLPEANKTIVFGEAVIPMVNETLILALPVIDHKLNPDGEPELNGYRLGTAVIDWLNGIWDELTMPVNVVTKDGVAYSVSVLDAKDALSSPTLTRI